MTLYLAGEFPDVPEAAIGGAYVGPALPGVRWMIGAPVTHAARLNRVREIVACTGVEVMLDDEAVPLNITRLQVQADAMRAAGAAAVYWYNPCIYDGYYTIGHTAANGGTVEGFAQGQLRLAWPSNIGLAPEAYLRDDVTVDRARLDLLESIRVLRRACPFHPMRLMVCHRFLYRGGFGGVLPVGLWRTWLAACREAARSAGADIAWYHEEGVTGLRLGGPELGDRYIRGFLDEAGWTTGADDDHVLR